MNWTRIVLGGLVAAVICFITDGALHEMLLKEHWDALFKALATSPPTGHEQTSMLWFAAFELLGRGLTTLFIYALARGRFGPGPKTAVIASIAAWFAYSLLGPIQMVPLGLFTTALWVRMAAFQLVTSIVAGIAGAALYKE